MVSSCRIREARIESSDRTSEVLTFSLLLSLVSPFTESVTSVDDVLLPNLEFHGPLRALFVALFIEEEAKACDVPVSMANPRIAVNTIMEMAKEFDLVVDLVWPRHRIIVL